VRGKRRRESQRLPQHCVLSVIGTHERARPHQPHGMNQALNVVKYGIKNHQAARAARWTQSSMLTSGPLRPASTSRLGRWIPRRFSHSDMGTNSSFHCERLISLALTASGAACWAVSVRSSATSMTWVRATGRP
jgi:hypothetical protein